MRKNLKGPLRTVIYDRKRLIIIHPQPFIWSRLVKDLVIQAMDGIGGTEASPIVQRKKEAAFTDPLLQGWGFTCVIAFEHDRNTT